MNVLVTGASGFVGTALVTRLAADGHRVLAAARTASPSAPAGCQHVALGDVAADALPLPAGTSADVVVHLAARVHVMHDTAADPDAAFRTANVDGSLRIARQLRAAGAQRFVFLSSIKVLGEQTPAGRPFDADTAPAPRDPYGRSKLAAERALRSFCDASGMELVIVRPPLVYGPGVKANFERLMRAVAARRPLPLGALTGNRRSLIALDNLVDLLARCVTAPQAAGHCFLAADGEDLSTADLARRLAAALGVAPRLLPVPAPLLLAAGRLLGRGESMQRLCGSLQVDIGEARRVLGWMPPVTVDQALASAAASLRRERCR